MVRAPELEELTHRLYAAVSSADPAFFEEHLSRGQSCVVIGTAPDEWWDDHATALAAIRAQMASAGDAVSLVAGDLRAFREGDVGWVSDRPMFRIGAVTVPCRHTSVFAREDGAWRIVQHHFSIGVANEAVFGDEAGRLG